MILIIVDLVLEIWVVLVGLVCIVILVEKVVKSHPVLPLKVNACELMMIIYIYT